MQKNQRTEGSEYVVAIRILKKVQFAGYKKWLSEEVEKKRAKGKDCYYLTSFILNLICKEKRFAFTGKQIKKLLELATEQKEKSASVGKP